LCREQAVYDANLHKWLKKHDRQHVAAKGHDVIGFYPTRDEALAVKLLASTTYGSTAARVKAFVEKGGECRATLFNYRRKIVGEAALGQNARPSSGHA
jgi:hypothetical protein